MLKLNQIYLRKILTWFILLFIILGFFIYFGVKNLYINELKKELLNDIKIVSIFLRENNQLQKNITLLSKNLKVQITILDQNYKILIDSNSLKKPLLSIYSQELKNALKNGIGVSIRYSKVLKKELIFIAKKEKINNKIYIIRISKILNGIVDDFLPILVKILIVITIFLMLIFYSFYKSNIYIEKEIKKILKALKALTKKKKDIYLESNFSKEFNEIAKLLTKVSKILDKRDKQKAKYTRRLEKINAQKDDIISAISHEFKNPIAVIDGYAQTMLEKNLNATLNDRFLKKIAKNTKKLSTLIDTLRLAIKLDDSQQNLRISKIDIKDLVLEIKECLKESSFNDREIVINSDDNIILELDKDLIEVALKNLIENALKYSDDEIVINITKNYLEVIDRGIGIEEKELEKITDKFYRINNNRWNNSLGLGLFIVKNILELHNMRLEIISRVGKGSIFRIWFKS